MLESAIFPAQSGRAQRLFWAVQSVCWLVYAVAAFLLIVTRTTPHPAALFLLKIWRSSLGLLTSFAIFLVLSKIPRLAPRGWSIAVAAVLSIALGYLWFIAFRISANPLRGLPLADWSFLQYSRDSVEQIAILLTCSAVYVAIRLWRDALDEHQRAADAVLQAEHLATALQALEARLAGQSAAPGQRDFIVVNSGRDLRVVRIDSIVSIQAAGDYSEIRTAADEKIFVLMSLKQWTERLVHHPFARVHRSTIVNLAYVKKIDRTLLHGADLLLKFNLGKIKVSRRKISTLRSLGNF